MSFAGRLGRGRGQGAGVRARLPDIFIGRETLYPHRAIHVTSGLMIGMNWMTLKLMVRRELAALLTLQPSTRPWQLPFAATMASGAPMLAGAASGQPALGALGAIAGLSFLYLPPVRLFQRIPIMMACAFAMVTSYGVGALGAMTPGMAVPLIGVVAILAMLFCKFYSLSPPGPIFMVMAAAIAAFTPTDAGHSFQHIGYFALGAAWACAVAIAYSVAIAGRQQPARAVLRPIADKGAALADSVITGIFVGVALLVALALQLEKPYWVPISCLAVIQGVTLRASWNRNIHR
ncbi:MAG: hypothetical protein B7Z20_09390, partial [Sphingobium sp. 32-64-5]